MWTLAIMVLTALLTQPSSGLLERIRTHTDTTAQSLIDIRRDLHRHPEVSGQEVRTARVVAERLRALGFEVQTGIGGHGVVGVLTGGRPGPLVAYRADMDAVPSTAPDPVEFRSVTAGVRHICGHDVHVAIGLGLAAALAHVKEDLPGRVMFVFQPSEERATGARAMLDAGLFVREKPVAIFGLHTAPFDAGLISSKPGLMMHPNRVAPGVTNDATLFASTRRAVVEAMGEAAWFDLQEPPAGFSEDFGAFQAQVPGVFFFLGVGNAAKGIVAMPHAPDFVVDESAIGFGVRAMAAAVIGRLTTATGTSEDSTFPAREQPLPLSR